MDPQTARVVLTGRPEGAGEDNIRATCLTRAEGEPTGEEEERRDVPCIGKGYGVSSILHLYTYYESCNETVTTSFPLFPFTQGHTLFLSPSLSFHTLTHHRLYITSLIPEYYSFLLAVLLTQHCLPHVYKDCLEGPVSLIPFSRSPHRGWPGIPQRWRRCCTS